MHAYLECAKTQIFAYSGEVEPEPEFASFGKLVDVRRYSRLPEHGEQFCQLFLVFDRLFTARAVFGDFVTKDQPPYICTERTITRCQLQGLTLILGKTHTKKARGSYIFDRGKVF